MLMQCTCCDSIGSEFWSRGDSGRAGGVVTAVLAEQMEQACCGVFIRNECVFSGQPLNKGQTNPLPI